jgi:hypothetical protein
LPLAITTGFFGPGFFGCAAPMLSAARLAALKVVNCRRFRFDVMAR